VGDGKLVQELSVWGSDPHMMGLAAYVHRDTDHGVHHGAPPFGVSSSVSRLQPRATPQRAAPSRWTLAGWGKRRGQHFRSSGRCRRPQELHPRLKPILPQNPMV